MANKICSEIYWAKRNNYEQGKHRNNKCLIDLSKIVLPSLFTLLAGSFGYRYGLRHMKNQKRLEFVERQLREFYSPMLGCLKSIKAKSELRYEISKACEPAWRKICEEHPKPFLDSDKYFEPFKESLMYDDKQLRKELIPLYDKMLSIFSENYCLAESETKSWYSELTRFVNWHRWLNESIPREVIRSWIIPKKDLHHFIMI